MRAWTRADLPSELRVERGLPRDELEAQAIVDHREAPRREGDPLTIDPGDLIAGARWAMRQTCFLRQPVRRLAELATPQGVDQGRGEGRAMQTPARQPFRREPCDALIERLADFAAKAGGRDGGRVFGDQVTVEPGRPRGRNLLGQRQVGADRERETLLTVSADERPGFDDRSELRVAGRRQAWKAHMMGPAVDAVDDDIGRSRQLVLKPAVDQAPDHIGGAIAVDGERGDAARSVMAAERPVHGLDDVAALAKGPQGGLGVGRDDPLGGTNRFGDAEALEMLGAADQDVPELTVVMGLAARPQVDHPAALIGIAAQRSVQTGPALRADLAAKRRSDVRLASRSELERYEALGLGPESAADIVAADDQVRLIFGASPNEDMNVRIVGVVMGDGHPVEARTEIPFRLDHQVAGEGLKVAHLAGVLGRHDEAEMMAVAFAPRREGAPVGAIGLGVEQPTARAVAAGPVAFQVAEMGRERGGAMLAGLVARDPGLDHNPACGTAQRRPRAGDTAAPEGRAAPARPGEPRAGMTRALGGPHRRVFRGRRTRS